jgi:predicted RNase H-like nuclease (RuvC/YqgF family)
VPAPLDTLQIVERLREAGFADPQAEALTTVLRDLREADFSSLATKADIGLLKTDIGLLKTDIERVKTDIERLEARLSSFATKTDLDAVRSGLEVKIAEMKVETIRWVFGIAFAQAALILAVLRLFPNPHP